MPSKFELIAVEVFKLKFRAEKRLMLLGSVELNNNLTLKQDQSKSELIAIIKEYDELIKQLLIVACE